MTKWFEGDREKIKLGHEGWGPHGPDHFVWDTKARKFSLPGKYEDDISFYDNFYGVQPKLKHWYLGDFPSHLSKINWKIKTMDKPKTEVESMEQIRLNVKRYYPIKYTIGDLSLTFWDDVHHESIIAIDKYFQNDVWSHSKPKKGWGSFKLRDSIVIPQFKIYEYTVENARPLMFTYFNAVLSSFDFDAVDDEGDESVHTIQMVFKVEGYSTDLM